MCVWVTRPYTIEKHWVPHRRRPIGEIDNPLHEIDRLECQLRKYKEIHKDSPENTECLRYLVHLCNELGGKDEVMSYAKKLKKLEEESRETKAQAREPSKTRGGAMAGSPAVRPPSAHGLRRDNAAGASKHAEEDADDDWGDTDLHLPGM